MRVVEKRFRLQQKNRWVGNLGEDFAFVARLVSLFVYLSDCSELFISAHPRVTLFRNRAEITLKKKQRNTKYAQRRYVFCWSVHTMLYNNIAFYSTTTLLEMLTVDIINIISMSLAYEKCPKKLNSFTCPLNMVEFEIILITIVYEF